MRSLVPPHLLARVGTILLNSMDFYRNFFFLSPKEEFTLEAQYPGGMRIISHEQNKADTGR